MSQKKFPQIIIWSTLMSLLSVILMGCSPLEQLKNAAGKDEGQEGIVIESIELVTPEPEEQKAQVPQNPEEIEAVVVVAEVDGLTAFDLLQQNAQINYKKYDFGFFVEDINGVKSSQEYFWSLYINGKQAQKGADQIILEKGDKMEWRYEKIK